MLQTGIFRVLAIATKSREREFLIARQALLTFTFLVIVLVNPVLLLPGS